MKAMLFAAGQGTRLQPMTNITPKCLAMAGGVTLLEHNIQYLKQAGVDSIVINVHHLADQVVGFVESNDFGVEVKISHEVELLETGGGLLKAKHHFESEAMFVVCNSDIYTDFDLTNLIESHRSSQNLATLAVAKRETTRYLRFNASSFLCGWEDRKNQNEITWSNEEYETWAFNGLQVLSPAIFHYMHDLSERFSTISAYLAAARQGEKIAAYPIDNAFWLDVGTPQKLAQLDRYLSDEEN
jgi:NDP-sugar pyrophosphorylase family protein